ncbi:hypothetical protein GEM_1851 [Burkholderia cepacia GG4]|uniref:Uncharacterized protein n=1 Tax=Burkholderia cepacia GG4 TaxID=1009846 RepID=A0A9W3P9B9_BURCE|nr:hypothetical protein GEM_1851 [Burkholderia cepacia GG4]
MALAESNVVSAEIGGTSRSSLDYYGFDISSSHALRMARSPRRVSRLSSGHFFLGSSGHPLGTAHDPATGSSTSTSDSFSLRTRARPRRCAFSSDSWRCGLQLPPTVTNRGVRAPTGPSVSSSMRASSVAAFARHVSAFSWATSGSAVRRRTGTTIRPAVCVARSCCEGCEFRLVIGLGAMRARERRSSVHAGVEILARHKRHTSDVDGIRPAIALELPLHASEAARPASNEPGELADGQVFTHLNRQSFRVTSNIRCVASCTLKSSSLLPITGHDQIFR